MRKNKNVGPGQVRYGFPKRPGWQQHAVSERMPAVEQDYIQVTTQRQVLESVIQHEYVGPLRQGGLSGSAAISSDPDRS